MPFFLPRFHRPVNRLFTRPEVTDDLQEPADTYLDVIQLSESDIWIQFAALSKKAAHGVKLRLAFFPTKLVERFHHRAVQIPRPQIRAAVPCPFYEWATISGTAASICRRQCTYRWRRENGQWLSYRRRCVCRWPAIDALRHPQRLRCCLACSKSSSHVNNDTNPCRSHQFENRTCHIVKGLMRL